MTLRSSGLPHSPCVTPHPPIFSCLCFHFTSQQMSLSNSQRGLLEIRRRVPSPLCLESKFLEVPSLSVHLPGKIRDIVAQMAYSFPFPPHKCVSDTLYSIWLADQRTYHLYLNIPESKRGHYCKPSWDKAANQSIGSPARLVGHLPCMSLPSFYGPALLDFFFFLLRLTCRFPLLVLAYSSFVSLYNSDTRAIIASLFWSREKAGIKTLPCKMLEDSSLQFWAVCSHISRNWLPAPGTCSILKFSTQGALSAFTHQMVTPQFLDKQNSMKNGDIA